MKRSRRVESLPPVPEPPSRTGIAKVLPLATAAAAKAAPLARSAAARTLPLGAVAAAAVPLARSAAERVRPLPGQAVIYVTPYAQQAAGVVGPFATHAAGAVSAYSQQAAGAVNPYAQRVVGRVGPYAGRLTPLATTGVQAAQGAVGRVGPAVGAARDRVSEDLLPKLSTALTAAATSPLAVEATSRGRATLAAARGELSLPVPQPAPKPSWVKRFAVVAAVGGAVAVLARQLLKSGDESGWQAARPSTTPPATPSPSVVPAAPVPGAGTDIGGGAATGPYGEGSFVGNEPPAGFVVKGNENSKKYHLPESSAYLETIAEVWFVDAEAAERAGFVRAQG